MKRIVRSGFTLIELLTVMAITAILMTVIIVPVYQSFNYTRYAQAFADAQDRARIVADRVSRDIGNAVGARNTSYLVQTTLNGNPMSVLANSLIVEVPIMGSVSNPNLGAIEVDLPYVKMDLITPAEGQTPATAGMYTNPYNGFIDPTLQSPKGQPTLPAGPGATIVRYFIGLRNPFAPYNDPYDGILMGFNGNRDNLFVLYKAEVQPLVYRTGTGTNGDISQRYRPNLAYFQSDSATDTQVIDIDDPRFFLNDAVANTGLGVSKLQRIQNWLAVSKLQTELSRFDMIQPVYDKFSHIVTYNGGAPEIVPLIQFRPAHISNDAAQGQVAIRPGEETNNAATISPDVYRTQFCLWSNSVARLWPQGWNPTATSTFQQYFVARNDPTNGQPGAPPGYSIYYYDPNVSLFDVSSGTEVFDMYTYDFVSGNQGLYPFSQAINAANVRSGWLGNPVIYARFTPFDMSTAKGTIITSFGINEVGNPNQPPTNANPQNLPTVLTSPVGYGPYSPINDPSYVAPVVNSNGTTAGYMPGNFYDPAYQSVNEQFNWVYDNATNLQQQIDRFIDLRNTPNADGTPSPLNPTVGFPKARIVPGSEVVYGPDQLPGPNYGNTVRYVRTTQTPGPNQYQINYVDQAEPTDPNGTTIDYTLIGLTPGQVAGFNPNVYSAQNFCSAVIQPRFKKGYLKFNSDPNSPLPIGPIQVSYRFQFNGNTTLPLPAGTNPSDVLAVDYDTRQLMSVELTMRNYPQVTNIPNPQTVTVKATADVRNVIR